MSEELLAIDFETRSAADLKKVGAHRYAEDSTTEVLCMAWKLADGPAWVWRHGIPFPHWVSDHIQAGRTLYGHNLPFDRLIWNKVLRREFPELAEITAEQCTDTMSRAQAVSLPAGLAKLGEVLQVALQKDLPGHNLMVRLCKPRKVLEDGSIVWWGTEEEFDRLGEYCARDVDATALIHTRVPSLSPSERRIYLLDQLINGRGVQVDTRLAGRAYAAAEEAKTRADRRIFALTEGAVSKVTETKKIVRWLNSRCIPCESVAKGETDELILRAHVMDDPDAEEVIALRRAAARTSTAKFKAMCDTANADGRIRGSLAYYGAYTGRWAGRNVQFQNFPRVNEDDEADVIFTLDLLDQNQAPATTVDALDLMTGKPMEVFSKCLRTMIIPAPRQKLVGGDFKNIEGRIAAWLSGEQWKVKAFQDFDAGAGPDLYYVTAAKILRKPIDTISKKERQSHGKVPELACGYQGGLGAFHTMAATNNVIVTDEEAQRIVDDWRDEHPAFVDAWKDMIDAAFNAVNSSGLLVPCLSDKIRFRVIGGMLYMKLPSTRTIAYPAPKITWEPMIDRKTGMTVVKENGEAVLRQQLSHMGVDSQTKRWVRQKLYGGLLFANAVSGTARDVMCEAMLRVEEAEYPLVLTVHDELLSEVADSDKYSPETYKNLMEIRPDWGKDIPITADTWEGPRYAK